MKNYILDFAGARVIVEGHTTMDVTGATTERLIAANITEVKCLAGTDTPTKVCDMSGLKAYSLETSFLGTLFNNYNNLVGIAKDYYFVLEGESHDNHLRFEKIIDPSRTLGVLVTDIEFSQDYVLLGLN